MSDVRRYVLELPVRDDDADSCAVPADADVLDVRVSMLDRVLETRDDTRYIVHLTNRSKYFVADDIHVTVELALDRDPKSRLEPLDDGNLQLEIVPSEQRIRCIRPEKSQDVVFRIITRGVAPATYTVDVTTAYRLAYVEQRPAGGTTQHPLVVLEEQ